VPEPVVQLAGLSRSYDTDPPVHALRNVDLTVHRGEWIAVVGPSGSGKSTLLNILGCLDVATAGTYRLAGQDVAALSDRERAGLRSRGIGFVFQTFHLLSHRSVLDNVMLAEVYRGESRSGRSARAMAALGEVGLQHRAQFLPTRLSGGEKQRVAIARALMGSPRLLLCDEPTGNLDSANTEAILRLFANLNARGLTIVMITHEHDVAERARRRVSIIDGRLTAA
jgi:ABC-type lipoprotein export system ATPase subunit